MKFGIISGMGTRAGLYFVNKLIDKIHAPKDQDFPEFILHNNSRVPDRTLAIVYGEESPEKELLRSINFMNENNVDHIIITCVTSFYYISKFDYSKRSKILNPIDLIYNSIKEKSNGMNRIGLLVTTGTLKSKLFQQRFQNTDFKIITLDEQDQEEKFMKSIYMEGGLKSSKISDDAFLLFQEAVEALKKKKIDMIIGGCTEVQIGYSKINETLPYFDVVDALVDDIIKKLNLKTI